MFNNLKRMVNGVWLMETDSLSTLLDVFDSKLNRDPIAVMQGLNSAEESSRPIPATKMGKALVIPISGTLVPRTGSMQPYCGMFPTNWITENIESVAQGYDTIIFHIDSGGGMATGIMEASEVIANLPQKTIAFVDNVSASGAYWLASACEKIYAHPSATIGSIGAYVAITKMTEKGKEEAKQKTVYFAKGDNKVMFNPDEPLSEKESIFATKMVEDSYNQFVDTVARNRGLDRQVIVDMKSGVFKASDVVGTLIDDLMTFNEVINL